MAGRKYRMIVCRWNFTLDLRPTACRLLREPSQMGKHRPEPPIVRDIGLANHQSATSMSRRLDVSASTSQR